MHKTASVSLIHYFVYSFKTKKYSTDLMESVPFCMLVWGNEAIFMMIKYIP